MGYDLHITRKDNWSDYAGPLISLAEWEQYVHGDPSMRMDNSAEGKTAEGSVIRVQSDGLAVWTAYSGHEPGGNMAWFYYRDGNISVKNPDEEILGKMIAVARSLEARVQGDEGEYYPREEVQPGAADIAMGISAVHLAGGGLILLVLAILWFVTNRG
ncbi:hypothetical protein [Microbulbifer yueqingensis]|uniref:Uncharacterized protein n=1 Tax=Microbulbifer yueqingensis TaxID=658219 RepID=A0A1G9EH75_9GAMM|nr:hypothetical protein [Microbulbifer yueqingensis]SDK75500.1 hypothetical protein SAMN05216212_3128 [Microbulbifer yueqingensis]